MKTNLLLLSCSLLAATTFSATDPYVTNVVVNQRWPWSNKVDIDYTLVTETNCDVEITATYAGCPSNLSLTASSALSSLPFDLAAGAHHLTWDPTAAGLSNSTLANFKVTLTAVSAEAHKYLILNMADGSCQYLADIPEGGWQAAAYGTRYVTTNLVFRRIPGGTFTMGLSSAEQTKVSQVTAVLNTHTVKLSHDYYIGIYPVTKGQLRYASQNITGEGDVAYPVIESYYGLRGNPTSSSEAICWPDTKYAVASGAWLTYFRAKAKATGFIIDLPTEAEWERACRAGTTTLFYNGGTTSDSAATLSNLVSDIAWWTPNSGNSANHNVGSKTANAWGLYDMNGLYWEWVRDWMSTGALTDAVDPTGTSYSDAQTVSGAKGPVRRSGTYNTTVSNIGHLTAGFRVAGDPAATWKFRLCIPTHPLFAGEQE